MGTLALNSEGRPSGSFSELEQDDFDLPQGQYISLSMKGSIQTISSDTREEPHHPKT